MIIYVHGPSGCGKTRDSERIARALGCGRIVDEFPYGDWRRWVRWGPKDSNVLVLSNEAEPRYGAIPGLPSAVQVLTYDEAMAATRKYETEKP